MDGASEEEFMKSLGAGSKVDDCEHLRAQLAAKDL
jgi:hypothetical protein